MMANEAKSSALDAIAENPLPAVLAGAGLGYLIFRTIGRKGAAAPPGYAPAGYGHPSQPNGVKQAVSGIMDRAAGGGDAVQHGAQRTADTVQHGAREAVHTVQHATGIAGDSAEQFGEAAQAQIQRTPDRINAMIGNNPIGATLMGIGVGAAIGMLFPATPVQGRVMGEASHSVVERAGEAAEQLREKASRVADKTQEAVTAEARR